jgi:methyl-accepting chemotaxis protein
MTASIDLLRRRALGALVLLLWAGVPLVLAAAWATGASPPLVGGIQAAMAAMATLAWRADPDAAWARTTAAAGTVGTAGVLVFAAAGTAYQVDMHMTFFVALALVAAMACVPSLLAAAGTAALHHLSLNLLVPFAVFPDGADFLRVVLHAVVVTFETAALIALALGVSRALEQADAAAQEARKAQAAVAAAAEERIRLEAEAQDARRLALLELAAVAETEIGQAADGAAEAAGMVAAAGRRADMGARKGQAHAAEAARAASLAKDAAVTMAASVEEIVASARELDQRAQHTARTAREAAAEGARGRQTAERLAQEAAQAQDLLKAIAEITQRTTILALNATIEAARAGDAGRGFAIVANEVKDLASQTAKTADQVAQRIARITTGSAEAHAAAVAVENRLSALAEDARMAADALIEQTHAGQEIARGVAEASREAERAAEAATAGARASTEAAQAAAEVAAGLETIVAATGEVRYGLERFVGGVRKD